MAQKRARLSDNDPLSPTDRVLAGFEQHSKKTSQLVDQPESQEDDRTSQQVSKSESQQEDDHISQKAGKPGSQEVTDSIAQPSNKATSQEAGKSSSQVAVKSKESNLPAPEAIDKSPSRQVDKPTIRKATFQISDAVLQQLDTFHLQLQLELGKANAPYKEVIVEEAIARILTEALGDRASLITDLQERQQQREA